MMGNRKRVAAGTASGIFAMLSALLALFMVTAAFVVSQPTGSVDPLVSHGS